MQQFRIIADVSLKLQKLQNRRPGFFQEPAFRKNTFNERYF